MAQTALILGMVSLIILASYTVYLEPRLLQQQSHVTVNNQIRHLLFLSFRDDYTPQQVQHVIDSLVGMKDIIPEIKQMTSGIEANNASEKYLAQGFTHVFVMVFDSEADRDSYLVNPYHVALGRDVVRPALRDGGLFVFDMK